MIEVGRNSIVIRNVDAKDLKTLNFKYGIWDQAYHKYSMTAFTQLNNDVYIPESIGLENIQPLFPKKQLFINYKNIPIPRKINYKVIDPPRDELQKNAISFLMKMTSDEENHQRFLSLETGKGKTYITISTISQIGEVAMVIVDGVDLAAQWKREFLKHTDLQESDIEILSGAEAVESAKKTKSAKIYIAIHRTLSMLVSDDINQMNILMNKLGVGIRVFDEAHVEFKNICLINSISNVNYTLYLTATPERSSFMEDSLFGKVLRRIPFFNGKTNNDVKYHTVITYEFDSKPSEEDKLKIKTKYGLSANAWSSYILESSFTEYYTAIKNLIDKLKLLNFKKMAIMVPKIDLIEKLKETLTIDYPDVEIGVFIGDVSKKKREIELSKKVILTNDKIFNKGLDVKDLEIVLMSVPLSSQPRIEQIIGRLRNVEGQKAILIDLYDGGFVDCVKQFKLRKRFYKKKAKKIIELK